MFPGLYCSTVGNLLSASFINSFPSLIIMRQIYKRNVYDFPN